MSEHAEQQRRRLGGVPLPGVGSFVIDRVNDAVALLRFLPDIATALKSIDSHVASMDREVHLMREGVERLGVAVGDLRGDVTNLSLDLESVAERIERLEPHVADLSRLARPLKRMRGRLPNGERTPQAERAPQGEPAAQAERAPRDGLGADGATAP